MRRLSGTFRDKRSTEKPTEELGRTVRPLGRISCAGPCNVCALKWAHWEGTNHFSLVSRWADLVGTVVAFIESGLENEGVFEHRRRNAMNKTTLNYPGFQELPKGAKQMLLASEAYFFEESASSHAAPLAAPQIAKASRGLKFILASLLIPFAAAMK
jgi:hypothetical protein